MDVWKSDDGRIELRHGDSRDVVAGMPDGSVDFIFTDPPYGHNNNNGDLIHNWENAFPGIAKKRRRGADLQSVRERALGQMKPGETYEARPIMNDDADDAEDLAKFLFRESSRIMGNGVLASWRVAEAAAVQFHSLLIGRCG